MANEETRVDDPQTAAALRALFDDLIAQNQPEEKSYVLDKTTYDGYLRTLLKDKGDPSPLHDRKFSNRLRFRVLRDENGPFLARAHSNKRLYHKGELFDVIYAAHKKCNHGNGKQTYLELKEFADNIFAWQCLLLTKICFCKRKKNKTSKCRSPASPRTNSGTFELVNMESKSDSRYIWILLYRDDMTSFLFGRPLKSRESLEVATELLLLFLSHGAPLYIYSSLSRGYVLKVLKKLYGLWPECPSVFGQQNRREINSEFPRLLDQWMAQSGSTQWSIGCHFVCSALNGQFSRELGNTPYRLMHRTTLEDASLLQPECRTISDNADDVLDFGLTKDDDLEISEIIAPDEESVPVTAQDLSRGNGETGCESDGQLDESLTVGLFRFPFSETEDCRFAEIDAIMKTLKIIENTGRGDCLYHVFRQHIKAFCKREYTVEALRQRIHAFLSEEDLGKEFIRMYHPDINPENLRSNHKAQLSWGGPESLFAISQILNMRVTVFTYIRDPEKPPYISRYWPITQKTYFDFPMPSAFSMCIKYASSHYTLLLPLGMQFPPKRFKRGNLLRDDTTLTKGV